jgi:hypothetical protein
VIGTGDRAVNEAVFLRSFTTLDCYLNSKPMFGAGVGATEAPDFLLVG